MLYILPKILQFFVTFLSFSLNFYVWKRFPLSLRVRLLDFGIGNF